MLGKIIDSCDISPEDIIFEIGPGIGGLTEALAEKCGKVIAIEIDRNLIPVLEDSLSERNNIEIVNADVMKLDLNELIHKEAGETKVKFAANLPYYITTPIIMNILEKRLQVSSLTMMVQKEVGERMRAKPGSKDYGALTLAVAYYADCYLAANVPRNCFMPRPNVDSAVIKLTVLNKPKVEVNDEELFFRLIKAGFSQRRKTLVNCLSNSLNIDINKEKAIELIRLCGLPEDIRGEKLDIFAYALLANTLKSL